MFDKSNTWERRRPRRRLRWTGNSSAGTPALPGLALGLLALKPLPVAACAACFGQSDGPMAQGMNWGIFSLLGIIVLVLGGVAGFFIYLARRSAAMAGPMPTPASSRQRVPVAARQLAFEADSGGRGLGSDEGLGLRF